MKTRKIQTIEILDPIFNTAPIFILNCSYEVMRSYIKRKYGHEVQENNPTAPFAAVQMNFTRYPWRLIWIKSMSTIPDHISILAHEIFHLVTRLCDDKGIPILARLETGHNGDETAAYLMQFFMREFLEKFRNRRKNRK